MKKGEPLIITLDGPSGSGKSTASLKLARHFDVPCLDTGAMYRSVALRCLKEKVDLADEAKVVQIAERLTFDFGFENGEPWVSVSDQNSPALRVGKEIRTPEVSMGASKVAKLPQVRAVLVRKQQEIGIRKGAVVEGRDAGTVIFPKAQIKFFVTASIEERARRRHAELKEALGTQCQSYEEVLREMTARDEQDEKRAASPSKPAPDAILIDTSGLDLEGVVKFLIEKVESANKREV